MIYLIPWGGGGSGEVVSAQTCSANRKVGGSNLTVSTDDPLG